MGVAFVLLPARISVSRAQQRCDHLRISRRIRPKAFGRRRLGASHQSRTHSRPRTVEGAARVVCATKCPAAASPVATRACREARAAISSHQR